MFQTKEASDNIIIYLAGRLDVHTSSDIEVQLDDFRLKNPDKNLIFDMSRVEYVSSSGLRMLVSLMRALNAANKTLKLCQLGEVVAKVFAVVELMDMFDIYDDEASAIQGKH